jgi:hypothetical protein
MTTLTIDRNKLVDALMDANHISGGTFNYVVAVNDEGRARVIVGDTPSTMGGYFNNYAGERNYDPSLFLSDDGNDYTWGEDGTGTGENGTWTEADDSVARSWIEENLLAVVELDGETFTVQYE